jgi:hypothetical protein
MVNQIRNPNEEMVFVRCICLIGTSLAGCAACWWAAGNSLGLFFGGLFVVTFLTPAAILGQKNLRGVICGLAAVAGPIAAIWLIATLKTSDALGHWIAATAVLVTYALSIAGIAALSNRCKLPEIVAAALTIVIGLAWLTWPVWLSATLETSGAKGAVENIVNIHPPLVINGILTRTPAWTEMSLAYHLTNLNQDVPVRLPNSAVACVVVHGMVGISFWLAAEGIAKRTRRLYSMGDPIFREK